MAKEINVDVKVTGLADLRSQLKQAREDVVALQSADVIDPAAIATATSRAGELRDRLNDANEQIKIMSGGTEFERVSAGLGVISDQISNLDFEGAAATARNLTTVIKGMDPKEVMNSFKGFITTIGQLGNAFFQMGLKLLANPLFLIPAIIIGIVVAIVALKDKLKIAEVAFEMGTKPIKIMIQALKDLTDWLGITQNAEEEAAEKSLAAAQKRSAASKKLQGDLEKDYDRRIALAKAEGKDTTALEIEKTVVVQNESAKRVEAYNNEIAKQNKLKKGQSEDDQKATKAKIEQLRKDRDEDLQVNRDAENERKVITAENAREAREAQEKERQKNLEDQRKANDKAKEEEKRRQAEYLRDLRAFQKAIVDAEIQESIDKKQREAEEKERVQKEIEDASQDTINAKADEYKTQQKGLKEFWANQDVDFNIRRASLKSFEEQVKNDTKLTGEEKKAIIKENSDAIKKIDDEETQSKRRNLDLLASALSTASNLLGESTAEGKALALASAAVSTYLSAQQAYASQIVPGDPSSPIRAAVAAGVAVATGLANIKKILAVKVPGKASGGGAASSVGAASASTPALALFGRNNNQNVAEGARTRDVAPQQPNITVTAVVSETQVTSAQNRVSRIERNAEL